MNAEPLAVGMIGCGDVTRLYLEGRAGLTSFRLVACADVDAERARQVAAKSGMQAMSVEDLLADPAIDIVLNLTPPLVHAEVTLAALAAGKHVYSEKPLATDREAARRILDTAAAAGLRIGCAPDTFLGSAFQTARALIDEGAIGDPIGCSAAFMARGPELWHHRPDIFYTRGGGPGLDVGPYYVTALVSLLGPVASVVASAKASFPTRTIRTGPRAGEAVTVTVPTHSVGVLTFASGAIGPITMSFDTGGTSGPDLEVYGSEALLTLPDPNWFDGAIRTRPREADTWSDVAIRGTTGLGRGIGLADMADSIRDGTPHRASGELAFHVLDVLLTIEEAAAAGRSLAVASTCSRPEAIAPA